MNLKNKIRLERIDEILLKYYLPFSYSIPTLFNLNHIQSEKDLEKYLYSSKIKKTLTGCKLLVKKIQMNDRNSDINDTLESEIEKILLFYNSNSDSDSDFNYTNFNPILDELKLQIYRLWIIHLLVSTSTSFKKEVKNKSIDELENLLDTVRRESLKNEEEWWKFW